MPYAEPSAGIHFETSGKTNELPAPVSDVSRVRSVFAVVSRAKTERTRDTSLTGAGSSFVFPLVSKWIPALGSAYGINVTYSPVGSGGGIAAITAKTVDFGASDAPLS